MKSLGRARPAVGPRSGRLVPVLAAATAALVSLGVLAAPAGASARATVTASAVVPGTGGPYNVERPRLVMLPGGRAALTLTSAGLTKYAVGPHAIKRLGTARMPAAERRSVTDLVVVGGHAYLVESDRIQLFDVSRGTPRKGRALSAKTLFPGQASPEMHGAALDPRTHRLFVATPRAIRVLRVHQPARPRLGTGSRVPAGLFSSTSQLAVRPNSSGLVAVGDHDTPGCGEYTCLQAEVAVFSVSSAGAAVLRRRTSLKAPWWPAAWSSLGRQVRVDPSGATAYVEVQSGGETADGPTSTAVAGVRLSDVHTHWLPRSGPKVPHLRAVSGNGARVYLTTAYPEDQGVAPVGGLVWADRRLTTQHAGPALGNVREVQVSPAGATKGLVYVLARSGGKLRLSSVRFR